MGIEHQYLDRVVSLFTEELDCNLVAIYLHGSLAMGCYHENQSDIDLLIVVRDKLSTDQMKRLAKGLLKLYDSTAEKLKLELSIVLHTYLTKFIYPTPFEFHYSEYHREKYAKDEQYICGGYEDTDLAAHIMVTYHRGVVLYGKPIKEVIVPMDEQYYIQSIVADVASAVSDITENPLYYTLNLLRVLYYVKEGVVSSKKEAGEWGLNVIPDKYHALVQTYLKKYNGKSYNDKVESETLVEYAAFMLQEIHQLVN